MFNIIKKIVKYPRLTQEYPKVAADSSLFIGKPEIDLGKCNYCGECQARCPSSAIVMDKGLGKNAIEINYGKCIFCTLCEEVCPNKAIKMTNEFELATRERNMADRSYEEVCDELKTSIKKKFNRSLQIREVDSGSCNGCDYEINALSNPFNDIERLGINFVASPRHADMLLVTGTATRNMQVALAKTYDATPDPKLVVAVGACACSGGIFQDTYATCNGIDSIVPVDVYVPGCPPRPQAILYGILKALDKV
jgi:Ni,Fe-hydrogenase III small subunit/ferredoxin